MQADLTEIMFSSQDKMFAGNSQEEDDIEDRRDVS